jgi:GT2 family glycosyltransferase
MHQSGQPIVSVIIPVYNAEGTLLETLNALVGQDFEEPFETIVADNGSTDRSVEIAQGFRELLPDLRVVDASDRPGASYARNSGGDHARAALLAFCDADDRPSSGWLRNLVSASECGRAAVAGRLEYDTLNSASIIVNRNQDQVLPRLMQYHPFASTANLLVPANSFHAVRGFDQRFTGAGGEDVDLSWKLQEAGIPLVFAPEAIIHYRLRESRKASLKRLYHYATNDPLVYKLHRHAGARRRSPAKVLLGWFRLAAQLPLCIHRPRRHHWERQVVKQFGWVVGSMRHRVIFL